MREHPDDAGVGQHVHRLLDERGVHRPHDGRGRAEQGGAAAGRAVAAEEQQHQHGQGPGAHAQQPLPRVRDVGVGARGRHDKEGGQPDADREGGQPGPAGDAVVHQDGPQAQREDQLKHQDRLHHRQRAEVQGEGLKDERTHQAGAAQQPHRLAHQVERVPPGRPGRGPRRRRLRRLRLVVDGGEALQDGAARAGQGGQDGEDDRGGHGDEPSALARDALGGHGRRLRRELQLPGQPRQ